MDNALVILEELPDAWRQNVHGVAMSRDEYDLSCEIENALKSDEVAALISAILIGKKLIDFKEKLGHGRFGIWRRCRFGDVNRTCQRNMQMARYFGSCPEAVSHLPLTLMRDVIKRDNWILLEKQIKSDIEDGKPLIEAEIRANLPSKSINKRYAKTKRIFPASEEEVVDVIVDTIKSYDKSVWAIVSRMDQGRLGEMIIERVLTGT